MTKQTFSGEIDSSGPSASEGVVGFFGFGMGITWV
jgi:hypothetical protein